MTKNQEMKKKKEKKRGRFSSESNYMVEDHQECKYAPLIILQNFQSQNYITSMYAVLEKKTFKHKPHSSKLQNKSNFTTKKKNEDLHEIKRLVPLYVD